MKINFWSYLFFNRYVDKHRNVHFFDSSEEFGTDNVENPELENYFWIFVLFWSASSAAHGNVDVTKKLKNK